MKEEIIVTFKHLKIEKAPGTSEIYTEMILASGDIGIRVLMTIYHRILEGNGMPVDWVTSVAIPFLRKKRYHEQWNVRRCKVTGTCNKNSFMYLSKH